MKKLELNVEGMHCTGCENRIKNVVSDIKEVKKVEVNHKTGRVDVTFKKDVDEDLKNDVVETIKRLEDFTVIE